MKSNYTPGPWHIEHGTWREGIESVMGYDPTDGRLFTLADVFGENAKNDQSTMSLANAQLIAAAPELLEALEALSHGGPCWCQMAIGNPIYTDHSEACKKARAAAAKAKGEA